MILQRTYSGTSALIGAGLMAGGLLGNSYLYEKNKEELKKVRKDERNDYFRLKLIENFKKKNGENNFHEEKKVNNAFALPPLKNLKDKIESLSPEDKKMLEKEMKDNPVLRGIIEVVNKGDPNKPAIVCDPHFNEAGTLSHEIGHTEYFDNRDNGRSEIVKVAHKYPAIFANHKFLAPTAGFAAGFGPGIARGAVHTAVGVEVGALMVRELAASRRGLKLLKKLGATDEELAEYRRRLGIAAGTYATMGAFNIGGALLGTAAGKALSHKLFK